MKKEEKPKSRTHELCWDFLMLLLGLSCGIAGIVTNNGLGEFFLVMMTMFIMFMAGWFYKEDISLPKH